MALENKLGIKSSAELAREEERISKKKAVELFENGMLENLEAGKFQTLCEIHKLIREQSVSGQRKKQLPMIGSCLFLWTAHRFSHIELNRVTPADTVWSFNRFLSP